MIKENELVNVEWKPCTMCQGTGSVVGLDCDNCQGHGVEPVEVENELCVMCKGKKMTPFGMITAGATREDNGKGQSSTSSNNCQCCYDLNGIRTGYKHQVGVEFTIPVKKKNNIVQDYIYAGYMKFLPIRVEGRSMWVVKI